MLPILEISSTWNCPQVTLWAMRQLQECQCAKVLEFAAKGNSVDVARAVLKALDESRNQRNLTQALDTTRYVRKNAVQDDRVHVCGALPQGTKEIPHSWLRAHQQMITETLRYIMLNEQIEVDVACVLPEHISDLKEVKDVLMLLKIAVSCGVFLVAERLLRLGADGRTQTLLGRSLLAVLLSSKCSDILGLVLKDGPVSNSVEWHGDSLLHLAAGRGMTQCIQRLINAGADYTLPNQLGNAPVHIAASKGHVSALQCLVGTGADPRARDRAGRLPLHRAGNAEVVHFLLGGGEVGSDASAEAARAPARGCHSPVAGREDEPSSASALAAGWRGDTRDCEARDSKGRTPLHWAARRENEEVIAALLHHGADPNAVDRMGRTPLHVLADVLGISRPLSEKAVQLFLDRGANVRATDYEGRLLLHYARGKVVHFLLGAGADPNGRLTDANARDSRGRTPLHCAVERREEETVQALIDCGSDPVTVDHEGQQPILYLYKVKGYLYEEPCVRITHLVLKEGVNINASDQTNQTLLHHAASRGHYKMMHLLLERGAQANTKDSRGCTPADLLHQKENASLQKSYDMALSALRQVATRHDEFPSI